MDDKKTDVNKEANGSLTVNLSAGDDKIKYYECKNDNCIFEIVDDENKSNNESIEFNEIECEAEEPDREFEFLEDKRSYDTDEKAFEVKQGKIIVKSIIDYGKKEVISGVKINLYKINGLSPILVKSQLTNEEGEVVFSNIEDGSYRVIEIVNKEYFEKPKYINWNEITIDCNNKKEKILVVNKLKKYTGKHN